MATFENILVPTDFGPAAEHAADIGANMALAFGARLTLAHVVAAPFTPYAPGLGGFVPGALSMEETMRMANEALEREAKRVRKRFPELQTKVIIGYPWRSIVELVLEHSFDLIILGTHGRRGVDRLLVGSVAEKVVRASPVPVLTIHARD